MLHKSFLKNNYGGLDTLFTNIPIHFNNYEQHRQKKMFILFIYGTNSSIGKIILKF
jgi:hypothetical protein